MLDRDFGMEGCVGMEGEEGRCMSYIVLALLRPGVDREVKVAGCLHIAVERDVSGLRGLPAFARGHV